MKTRSDYLVVGRGVPRVDAREKACGEAKFVDDISLPGMLHAATLKSPYAHARILTIDTSKAEKLPGVKAVITGKDIGPHRFCVCSDLLPGLDDQLPLEKEKVRFIGDEVAAVAAVDPETAQLALGLINVTYEVLPTVLDPKIAMEAGSPRIHDKERNISVEIHYDFGNVDKGFEEADHIFKDKFITSQPNHCCMETHGCIAQWGDDGRLTLWSSTQNASFYRRELAKVMDIRYGDIRFIQTKVGGSFGGKLSMHTIEPIAAYLAKKTGQPVKIIYDREEEFISTRTRHPVIIELKTGVNRDGTIKALEAEIIMDNGAYNDFGPAVLHEVAILLCSYYKVKNVRVNGYLVYTNKPYGSAFRGFGNPQAAFAIESQMDIIAKKLNIDPVEIRIKNANEPGDITACGWEITTCALKECIEKAATAIGWKHKRGKANKHGVGIAACIHWGGGLRAGESDFCSAIVEINSGGQAYIYSGENEIGEGAQTVVAQIVAEELGMGMKDVKLMPLDTDICPSLFFAGSPTTFVAGGAAKAAASDAKRQILEMAAEMKDIDIKYLDLVDGYIFNRRNNKRIMPISEVTHFSYEIKGIPIIGKGRFNQGPTQYDMLTGAGQLSPTYAFAAQAVEVAVDPETGTVELLEFISAHDSGMIINPMMAEAQVYGGLAQGIGYALIEGLVFDKDGKTLNSSFADYKILRTEDMPERMNIMMIKTIEPKGPFEAKALGEATMVPVAPAIANAIEDAVGIRITELPISPEKIVNELNKKRRGEK